MQLSAPELKPGESLTAKIRVKNTGLRAGTEVLQLYIRGLASTAGPRPVRELKGFQKSLLQSGESRDASFVLTDRELGCYDVPGKLAGGTRQIPALDFQRFRLRFGGGVSTFRLTVQQRGDAWL